MLIKIPLVGAWKLEQNEWNQEWICGFEVSVACFLAIRRMRTSTCCPLATGTIHCWLHLGWPGVEMHRLVRYAGRNIAGLCAWLVATASGEGGATGIFFYIFFLLLYPVQDAFHVCVMHSTFSLVSSTGCIPCIT